MIPITSFRTPALILEQKRPGDSGSGPPGGLELRSHAGRGQIRVLVLQLAVQRDATPLSVIGQQRQQRVGLLQAGSWGHGVPETWTRTCLTQLAHICTAQQKLARAPSLPGFLDGDTFDVAVVGIQDHVGHLIH